MLRRRFAEAIVEAARPDKIWMPNDVVQHYSNAMCDNIDAITCRELMVTLKDKYSSQDNTTKFDRLVQLADALVVRGFCLHDVTVNRDKLIDHAPEYYGDAYSIGKQLQRNQAETYRKIADNFVDVALVLTKTRDVLYSN